MLVIPAIDLRDGCCVRLLQGRASEMQVYHDDPLVVARGFAAAGAELIHIVDLDGAFAGGESPNRAIAGQVAREVEARIQFGGGIRTSKDIDKLLNIGVARVVLGTLATESLEELERLVQLFGEGIAVGIDAREGKVMAKGWITETNSSAVELATAVAATGVRRIVYTDISRDGMLTGSNIGQTNAVASAAGIAVTASGGIGSLKDLEDLRTGAHTLIDSVIVGKALYEGRFTLEQAIQTTA